MPKTDAAAEFEINLPEDFDTESTTAVSGEIVAADKQQQSRQPHNENINTSATNDAMKGEPIRNRVGAADNCNDDSRARENKLPTAAVITDDNCRSDNAIKNAVNRHMQPVVLCEKIDELVTRVNGNKCDRSQDKLCNTASPGKTLPYRPPGKQDTANSSSRRKCVPDSPQQSDQPENRSLRSRRNVQPTAGYGVYKVACVYRKLHSDLESERKIQRDPKMAKVKQTKRTDENDMKQGKRAVRKDVELYICQVPGCKKNEDGTRYKRLNNLNDHAKRHHELQYVRKPHGGGFYAVPGTAEQVADWRAAYVKHLHPQRRNKLMEKNTTAAVEPEEENAKPKPQCQRSRSSSVSSSSEQVESSSEEENEPESVGNNQLKIQQSLQGDTDDRVDETLTETSAAVGASEVHQQDTVEDSDRSEVNTAVQNILPEMDESTADLDTTVKMVQLDLMMRETGPGTPLFDENANYLESQPASPTIHEQFTSADTLFAAILTTGLPALVPQITTTETTGEETVTAVGELLQTTAESSSAANEAQPERTPDTPSNEPQSAKPAEVTPTEKITATTSTPVKKNIPIPQRTDRSRSDILIEQLNTKPQKFQVPEATVRDPVVTLRDIAKVVPSKKRQCPATVTSQQQIDDEKAAEEHRTTKQPSTTTVNDRRSSVSSSERHERQFTAENPPQPIKRAKIAQPRNEKTEKPRRAEATAVTTTVISGILRILPQLKWLISSIRTGRRATYPVN